MENLLNFQGKTLRIQQNISSEVFTAEETISNLQYTIKHVKNPSPKRKSNLRNEIKILKANTTSHPNIISLY